MIQSKLTRVRVTGAAAIVFAVSACGGGGGGGGNSPPPPPPPSAVTANASVNVSSVPEGQSFTLNASGSTTNGQPLSYSWSQVSGPNVAIANPNSAQLILSAAEVTADSAAQFRVTVTAGADSAQATANVTFTNIAQTPTYNNGSTVLATVTFSVTPRVLLGSPQFGIAGVADVASDPLTFLDFTLPNGQLQVTASQLPSLPQTTRMELTSYFPQNAFGSNPPFIAATEEAGNRFRIFGRAFSAAISTIADFTLTAPCGMSHASIASGTGLFIGQRNGYSIISGSAAASILRTVTTNRPTCVLLAPRGPINDGPFAYPGPTPALQDLITVDTTANTVTVYQADGVGIAAQYQQVTQVPVQLDSAAPLSFVGWTETSSNGFSSAMALIYSDGAYNGQHRLVVIGLDRQRALVQRTHSFSGAAPTAVFTDNIDVDTFYPEIVVISPKSPQAVIFEPTAPQGAGFGVQPLGPPQYLEIGLGATAAVPKAAGMVSSSGPLNGMVVAYPDRKQVKVIGLAP